jgi:mRNA-degrading endonuclease RelE of RelBE toxin-antitoxin system
MVAVRVVYFTADALRQFKKLAKPVRTGIREAVQTNLVEADPAVETRNRFRLRRISPHADYELRVGRFRIFYRIEGRAVLVTLIGEKRGATLIVEGEELKL